ACRHVGDKADGEERRTRSCAAGDDVVQPEHPTVSSIDEVLDYLAVDTRQSNARADLTDRGERDGRSDRSPTPNRCTDLFDETLTGHGPLLATAYGRFVRPGFTHA